MGESHTYRYLAAGHAGWTCAHPALDDTSNWHGVGDSGSSKHGVMALLQKYSTNLRRCCVISDAVENADYRRTVSAGTHHRQNLLQWR